MKLSAAAAALIASLLALAPVGTAFAGTELPGGGLLETDFGRGVADVLAKEGFDRKRVETLLADPRVGIVERTIAYAIVYREVAADYSRFLSEERLSRAREFLAQNKDLLDRAETANGVPREVIAAILMIESNFGAPLRTYPVLNVFLTLLWAAEEKNFDAVRAIVQERLPDVTAQKIRERTKSKAKWARQQLGFLMRIDGREKLDLPALEGSWAGAFGLPQFIPSSYWDYAADGDGDGRIELFTMADAVFSVGNYLKRFGWREGMSEDKRRGVIRRYNNSDLYTRTVLDAAKLLAETKAP